MSAAASIPVPDTVRDLAGGVELLVCSCGFRHTFAGWLSLPLDGHQDDDGRWLDLRSCRSCRSTRAVVVDELVALDRGAYLRNLVENRPIVNERASLSMLAAANLTRVLATYRWT